MGPLKKKKLRREEYKLHENLDYTNKEYDSYGNLIFEEGKDGWFHYEERHFYDANNRRLKTERQIDGDVADDPNVCSIRFVEQYDYFPDLHRVVNTQTHIRILNEEEWTPSNETSWIKETKFFDGLVIQESTTDLKAHTQKLRKIRYENNVIVFEETKDEHGKLTRMSYTNGLLSRREVQENGLRATEYSYSDSTLKKTVDYEGGQKVRENTYHYERGLLKNVETISYHAGMEYLSYQTLYSHNSHLDLVKTEYFGRFNEKMYCYKIEQHIYDGYTHTKRISEIPYFEVYSGYFNFQEMMKSLDEMWVNDNVHRDMFEGDQFLHTTTVQVVHPIHHITEVSFLASNDEKTLESKEVIKQEFDDDGNLEFEVKFNIYSRSLEIEPVYTKKLYYYQ